MRYYSLPIGIFAIAFLTGVATAQAAIETWVSGTGTDTGNCPRTAPCRTFGYAYGQTNNNGAINVLTSGNFGPLTILKPINIVAEGVEAVINSGNGGFGININVGANAVVSLRGLTIDMRGSSGNSGIYFFGGAALHVQNCVIRRSDTGVGFSPASGTAELYIRDSIIADNASSGLVIQSTGVAVKAVVDRVRVENNNGTGMFLQTTGAGSQITATVRNSVSAGNGGPGISAADSSGALDVMLDHAVVANNVTGVFANGPGAKIRMGNSTVTGNGLGLSTVSGVIKSYGTNEVNGNGTDGTPSSTIPMK